MKRTANTFLMNPLVLPVWLIVCVASAIFAPAIVTALCVAMFALLLLAG